MRFGHPPSPPWGVPQVQNSSKSKNDLEKPRPRANWEICILGKMVKKWPKKGYPPLPPGGSKKWVKYRSVSTFFSKKTQKNEFFQNFENKNFSTRSLTKTFRRGQKMVIFSITILKSQLCSKTQKIDPNFWTPLPPGGMGGYPPEKVKNDPKMTPIWIKLRNELRQKTTSKNPGRGLFEKSAFWEKVVKKWPKSDHRMGPSGPKDLKRPPTPPGGCSGPDTLPILGRWGAKFGSFGACSKKRSATSK